MVALFIPSPAPAVFRKDCSPGPGYFIVPTINRFGMDGTPTYSILGRQRDPSKCATQFVKFAYVNVFCQENGCLGVGLT